MAFCGKAITEKLLGFSYCLKCWCRLASVVFSWRSELFRWAQVLLEISPCRLFFLHLWVSVWTWYFSIAHDALCSLLLRVARLLCDWRPALLFLILKPVWEGHLCTTWQRSSGDEGVHSMGTPGSPLTHRHLWNMILFLSPRRTVTETAFQKPLITAVHPSSVHLPSLVTALHNYVCPCSVGRERRASSLQVLFRVAMLCPLRRFQAPAQGARSPPQLALFLSRYPVKHALLSQMVTHGGTELQGVPC